ncbi:MAG: hypothetical protein AAGC58_08740 [Asticcacaulis sp.]
MVIFRQSILVLALSGTAFASAAQTASETFNHLNTATERFSSSTRNVVEAMHASDYTTACGSGRTALNDLNEIITTRETLIQVMKRENDPAHSKLLSDFEADQIRDKEQMKMITERVATICSKAEM